MSMTQCISLQHTPEMHYAETVNSLKEGVEMEKTTVFKTTAHRRYTSPKPWHYRKMLSALI
ncbi:uncharacterized protein EpC_01540 [Erwinia pyrifoliae Ep1/96]|nr:uncharacterized protein EpC_01540 [Erwinia pyrifoliae Ep1/96]